MPTHVLLVGDDVGLAEGLAYGLETDGHTVEVAANGLLALAKGTESRVLVPPLPRDVS